MNVPAPRPDVPPQLHRHFAAMAMIGARGTPFDAAQLSKFQQHFNAVIGLHVMVDLDLRGALGSAMHLFGPQPHGTEEKRRRDLAKWPALERFPDISPEEMEELSKSREAPEISAARQRIIDGVLRAYRAMEDLIAGGARFPAFETAPLGNLPDSHTVT